MNQKQENLGSWMWLSQMDLAAFPEPFLSLAEPKLGLRRLGRLYRLRKICGKSQF